jgi:anti-sigma regulatory factor (Ser/Thr protein kinase)
MSDSAAVDRQARPIGFVTRSWRADPRRLREIRAELRRWLAPFELTTDAVHDVVLAVNEAVSNVIVHAYSPATIRDTVDITLRVEGESLRIEVVDHGRWRTPSLEPTERGRGITLMNRLMAAVLIHDGPRGTRVVLHYPLG